jgi:transcriptional regulator with XRE-family HTH domain
VPLPNHRRVLGEAIRLHRKRAGISQEKLAERASLSTVFISNIECGKQTISVDALVRIAKALGVSIREFFTGF